MAAASLPIDPLAQAREWLGEAASCFKLAGELIAMVERLEGCLLEMSLSSEVIDAVCMVWGVKRETLCSKKRSSRITAARAVAAYLLCRRFKFSTTRAGRILHIDHSAIITAYRKLERRMEGRDFAAMVGRIETLARSMASNVAVPGTLSTRPDVLAPPASNGGIVEGMESGK